MSSKSYCSGRIDKKQTVMELNLYPEVAAVTSKRVNIVSIKMVKEGSVLYSNRKKASPSEDISITTRLRETGKIIGIDVIDHIIIGFNNFVSLKEKRVI
jgi:hypothetical protein